MVRKEARIELEMQVINVWVLFYPPFNGNIEKFIIQVEKGDLK